MGESKRVVLVGHCGFDAGNLTGVVRRVLPGATVVECHDEDGFARELAQADLMLVNRVAEGSFASGSGVELIRAASRAEGRRAALMLISDFDWAQEEAEAAGAAPGFGKSAAHGAEAAARLRAAAAGARV